MGFMQQFQQQQPSKGQEFRGMMAQLRSMLQGDTSAAVQNLARTNPQFADFLSQNNGKSIEEAFRSYGYDLSEVLGIINS